LAKVDLAKAYQSIPISPACYQLTGLHWNLEMTNHTTIFMMRTFLFGAVKSCFIFQFITESICRMFAKRGKLILAYLDDLLCIGNLRESCQSCFDDMLNELGLDVNWSKVSPSVRKLVYLGVQIDCCTRTLLLPVHKMEELIILRWSWDAERKVTKLEVQRLVGKLMRASHRGQRGSYFL
jgi:hypothetical protein